MSTHNICFHVEIKMRTRPIAIQDSSPELVTVSDRRKYFLINLHKRMLGKTSGGGTLNLLITDVHPTELPRPAIRVDASMDISMWT